MASPPSPLPSRGSERPTPATTPVPAATQLPQPQPSLSAATLAPATTPLPPSPSPALPPGFGPPSLTPVRPAAGSASRLSPSARPFSPRAWGLESDEESERVDYEFSPSPSPSPTPPSYKDVVCGSSPPRVGAVTACPAVAADAGERMATAEVGEPSGTAGGRRRRGRPSRRVRQRAPPPPPLRVAPAPARVAVATERPAGPPAQRRDLAARLGPVPAPLPERRRARADEDGFQEYVSRSTRRRLQREAGQQDGRRPPTRRFPPELDGRDCRRQRQPHVQQRSRGQVQPPPRPVQRAPAAPGTGHAEGPRRPPLRHIARTEGPSTPPANSITSRTPSPPAPRR